MFGQGRAGPRRGAAPTGERLRQRPPRPGRDEDRALGREGARRALPAGGGLRCGTPPLLPCPTRGSSRGAAWQGQILIGHRNWSVLTKLEDSSAGKLRCCQP